MSKIRSYSEAMRYSTFEDRLKYLMLYKSSYDLTFGDNRQLSQIFYASKEWKDFRRDIIIRDRGCDLAFPDYEISDRAKLTVHHINPINAQDILDRTDRLMDPENVICVSFITHKWIHYGDDKTVASYTGRSSGDTCPWR